MDIKPYFLFLLEAIIFVVLCFFANSDSVLDINVHDTYFVIAHNHIYGLLAIILFTVFMFYWSLDKAKMELITFLSNSHTYGTLISIIGMYFPYQLIFKPSNFPLYDDMRNVNLCLSISGLLFLLSQILFIINIFVSIIKKLSNSAAQ